MCSRSAAAEAALDVGATGGRGGSKVSLSCCRFPLRFFDFFVLECLYITLLFVHLIDLLLRTFCRIFSARRFSTAKPQPLDKTHSSQGRRRRQEPHQILHQAPSAAIIFALPPRAIET